MTTLEQAFGNEQGGTDRVDRVLALVKRLQEIESASSTLRYDNELLLEIPEVLKTLGAAKDAVIAALKTV